MTEIRPHTNWHDAKLAVLEAGFELLYCQGPESVGATCHYWHPQTQERVNVFFSKGRGYIHRVPER